MKTLLRNPIGIFAALVMMVTLFVLPQSAQAKVLLFGGSDPGSPGGGSEGDPLDSNDYTGDGTDDVVHEQKSITRNPSVFYEIKTSSQTLMLRIEFIGDIPVFSIYAVGESGLLPEASHVR